MSVGVVYVYVVYVKKKIFEYLQCLQIQAARSGVRRLYSRDM